MKKKIVISILGIFVIMLGALGIFNSDDNQIKLENGSNSSNLIAMYIENDDGEYVASTNSTFPTDGYVLNTEKSICQNGGKPSQDSTTKAISLSTSVAESCILYFEKVKKPVIKNVKSESCKDGSSNVVVTSVELESNQDIVEYRLSTDDGVSESTSSASLPIAISIAPSPAYEVQVYLSVVNSVGIESEKKIIDIVTPLGCGGTIVEE